MQRHQTYSADCAGRALNFLLPRLPEIRMCVLKKFFIYTIFGIGLILASYAVHAQAPLATKPHAATFFHTLNDVPVMPGLRELTDEAVNFDKPEGRIVSATAVSDTVKPEAIKNFYKEALPQLGWQPDENGTFLRDQERLKLIIEVKEGVSIARLQVEPR